MLLQNATTLYRTDRAAAEVVHLKFKLGNCMDDSASD